MPLKGDTVRFEVYFKDFDGLELDYEPESVSFRVYNEKEEELITKTLTDANQKDENQFFYDYTIPKEFEGVYHYEFEGMFKGRPYIARSNFKVTF